MNDAALGRHGVLEAAKGLRRLKGCQDMPPLVAMLRARDQQLGLTTAQAAEKNRCLRISARGACSVAVRHQSSGLAETISGTIEGDTRRARKSRSRLYLAFSPR
jgi:hypothetical protein